MAGEANDKLSFAMLPVSLDWFVVLKFHNGFLGFLC